VYARDKQLSVVARTFLDFLLHESPKISLSYMQCIPGFLALACDKGCKKKCAKRVGARAGAAST
jgi:hypothetical protein